MLKFRNVKETSFVMTSTVDLFGGVEIHLTTKTKTAILMLFFILGFSVRLTLFYSCNSFKPLRCVTSVPHQNCSFSRRISLISSFDRDSVFVKKTFTITNRKYYLKVTIGLLHFSMKHVTILEE